MESKTIYVLRHGQTDLNLKGMVQGRGVNSSLNDTGRQQALLTFQYFKDQVFDIIYTSSLKRTHETVSHFNQEKIELEGLDEISWGNQEGVVPTNESKTLYAETVKEWQNGNLDANLGGGESPRQVMERQKKAMEVVLSNGDKNILICMHGRAMRILLSWFTDTPMSKMDDFEHANCCYYKLEWTPFRVDILERNMTKHLEVASS